MRLYADNAGGQAVLTDNGTVFANGFLLMRLGDRVESHGVSPHSPIPDMVTASPTVFAEGKPVCGVGDLARCGHSATGSGSVFVQ